MYKIIKIVLIFILLPVFSSAQSDCSLELKQAVDLYEKGQFTQVVSILSTNLKKCKYSDAEREELFRILISAYYEMDELEESDKYTKLFLKENPNYSIYSTDPAPFRNSLKRFSIKPKLSVFLKFGVNKISPSVSNKQTVWESADYSAPYETTTGHYYAFGIHYYLNDYISFSTGFDYQSHNFSRTITAKTDFIMKNTETYTDFRFPLLINYSYQTGKTWYPSAFAGFYMSKITIANTDLDITDKQTTSSGETFPYTDSNKGISVLDSRNLYNYGFMGGISLNYTFKKWIFSLNFAYSTNFINYTKSDSKYIAQNRLFDYFYIDDDIKTRSFEITLGFAYKFLYKIKSKY